MQTVTCGQCGKRYKAGPEMAGKRLRCKACGGVVVVPGVVAATAATAATPPPIPARKPVAVVPLGEDMVVRPAADPEEVDFAALSALEAGGTVEPTPVMDFAPSPSAAPARRSTVVAPGRKTGNAFAGRSSRPAVAAPRFGFRFNRFAIWGIVGGIALGIYGGKEMVLASHSSDTPQSLTCDQLGKNGYGQNANVKLTDFKVFPVCVYEFEKSNPSEWTTTWIPLLPPKVIADVKRQRGKTTAEKLAYVTDNIHVMLKTHTVKNEADMNGVDARSNLSGLVINSIESMSAKDKELLHGQFPTLDPDKCMVLEEGRSSSGGLGFAALAGGVLLVLVGLGIMFKPST